MNNENMDRKLKRVFAKDKKKITYIILASLIVLTMGSLFISIRLSLYVLIYFLLVLCSFYISKRWLTTLTLFCVQFTLCIGLGEIFIEIEKVELNYNEWLIVLGGYACVLIGYILGKRFKSHHKFKRIKILIKRHINWENMLYVTYLLSTSCLSLYIVKNRAVLFGNIQTGRVEAMAGNGMMLYIGQLHIMTVPLMYESLRQKRINKIIFWALCLFATVQLLLLGYRGPAAMMWITLIFIWVYEGRIHFTGAVKNAVLLIALLIFYGIKRSGIGVQGIYYTLRSHMFLGCQNLMQVFRCFPKLKDFQYGSTYLINIIMLKPGPDLDFTLWLKEVMGLNFAGGGITPTIMGEFYINFGYVGIFVGMTILGFIMCKIDSWILNGKEVGFWKAFMLFEVASCCDGGISNVYLLPLVFCIYYSFMCLISNKSASTTFEVVN